VQEIAIRVRLREQERVGLAEYERTVASVATVAALTAWLPTPDARLVIRGRGAEPVRLETVSYGSTFEMLVVLDQRSAAVERAAAAVAALIESVRLEHVEDDVAGVAGEIDRLDRSAPRGRSAVERSLRTFLEGARADVLARKSTTRLRAAQALVRLAEDAAEFTVERVEDALASELTEEPVDVLEDTGSAVVVEPVDGLEPSDPVVPTVPVVPPVPEAPEQQSPTKTGDTKKGDDMKKSSKKGDDKKKSSKKKDDKKKSKKDDEKKDDKKKSSKKDDKKKSKKQ
jgi:outer membrane biosynthesis protein TonB